MKSTNSREEVITALRGLQFGIKEDSLEILVMKHPVDPYLPWCVFEFTILEGVHVRMEINSSGYTITRASVENPNNSLSVAHYEQVVKKMVLEYHGSLESVMAKASPYFSGRFGSTKQAREAQYFECCR
ncbi:hypothetical protein K493DRAFT_28975 [Basidiobolus meristosporus CBS 931.73]|uniref:GSKIP domain-containing protein n=1 Tax=Basidiobolus meristosporus CBS 931.73 TaxID=1314790 RepID=A0A1Y1ZDH4_9FUNG|nr:hypothetical protein K493DRAFT_28975 [Basidiobolus meristosporus CBS 931.73]|eukprot:ORY08269.1 hypothetical protein K493DRAFT_28975 [Basidiobolus meristosporus CBS 931.73]